jgi:FkbM family methyltransferase
MTDASTPTLSVSSKTIILGGVTTHIEGAADDPYFSSIEAIAPEFQPLFNVVSRHVPRDATVIDVGGNIGVTPIALSRLVARVITFEPSPPNLNFLRTNLRLNGVDNVEIVAAAASNQEQTLEFHAASFSPGSHVRSRGDLSRGGPSIEVPAVSLDQFDFPPIAFMKIDAEGHEPEVLAGARRLLARDRPLMVMEINPWCLTAYADHNPGAFIRTLWERFEVWETGPDGDLTILPNGLNFLHKILQQGGVGDIVLRPRQAVEMPTLPELSWSIAAIEACEKARFGQ